MKSIKTNKSTPFLVAIAAFAVTATGVHAWSSTELLTRAGLSDDQVVAVQEAQELKASGDFEAAKTTLESAGIDRETMKTIKETAKEAKEAIKAAVEAGDYDAFVIASADSPLAEFVSTEDEFDQFVEAHELRADGDKDGAAAIYADLGIERDQFGHGRGGHDKGQLRAEIFEQLTEEQQEALQVAKAANDREAARAILEEAGVERPERGDRDGRGPRGEQADS